MMDPDITLDQLREAMSILADSDHPLDREAAELFGALDDWIMRGGFLPTDWLAHAPKGDRT